MVVQYSGRVVTPAHTKPRVARWLWWAGFVTFGGVGLILTALAYREMQPDFLRAHDKAAHFVLAGALVFFLDGALHRRALTLGGLALSVAWLLVLLPAGVEEYVQRFTTFRTSELGDYVADVAGATLFLWVSRRLDCGER